MWDLVRWNFCKSTDLMLHGANHAILYTLHYIFVLMINYLMSVCAREGGEMCIHEKMKNDNQVMILNIIF